MIIVSIRGTLSLSDIVNDLLFQEQTIEWEDEGAEFSAITHQGIYTNARNIYDELLENNIFNLLNSPELRDYKLMCTGHSLGSIYLT